VPIYAVVVRSSVMAKWLLILLLSTRALAQVSDAASADQQQDALKLHYEAAGRYARAGDQDQAVLQYKAFLAEGLHRIANGEASAGEFAAAAGLFDQALSLTPHDNRIRLDYARVALDAEKLVQARTLAEEAVHADPKDAQARFLLGSVLFHLEDYAGARDQLEVAIASNPDFKTGYLLARTYLVLHDEKRARMLFDEMIAGLGDSALIHVYFGRAYSLMDYPDQADTEFQKAIAKDSHAPDAHYYRALAYLRHDESVGYVKAIPEFEAELKINPNDVRCHYMLGYIALKQGRFSQAETDLSRAAALQPDVNTLVNLAEVYTAEGRAGDAEPTLRKAIVASEKDAPDQQRNGRAHYLLGRLLMKSGRAEEAKSEMTIAAQQPDTSGMTSGPAAEARVISSSSLAQQDARDRSDQSDSPPASSTELKKVEEYKKELSPAIGEAYNALGVFSAGKQDFMAALHFFEDAESWNPKLDGIDRNLGMAAFQAGRYDQAAKSLGQYVSIHSDDQAASAALADARKRLHP
jgi:tetratricopeptide (TPR) repeat protein